MKEIEFVGISSGDHESFCWDVTKEEYIRLVGHDPKYFDRSYFIVGLFRYYAETIFEPGKKYRVKMTIEEMK